MRFTHKITLHLILYIYTFLGVHIFIPIRLARWWWINVKTCCWSNWQVRRDFDRASSLTCGNKMPARCNRGSYCISYCMLNMFQALLCPSSGAQAYYAVVAACGIDSWAPDDGHNGARPWRHTRPVRMPGNETPLTSSCSDLGEITQQLWAV